jgi:hypothetical protein
MDRQVEVVEWIDPYSDDDEWTTIEKIVVDIPTVYSIGFVVKETKDVLVIAHSFGRKAGDKDAECCGMMIIPKRAIQKRRKINVGTRKKRQ